MNLPDAEDEHEPAEHSEHDYNAEINNLCEERRRLLTENTRLREALSNIHNIMLPYLKDTVEETLGGLIGGIKAEARKALAGK